MIVQRVSYTFGYGMAWFHWHRSVMVRKGFCYSSESYRSKWHHWHYCRPETVRIWS